MSAVVHPRQPPRRGRAWAGRWWARAWLRAVEEAAYDGRDLKRARTLARGGSVGAIEVDAGRVRTAVTDTRAGREDLWSVTLELPVLEPDSRTALVEAVAAEPERVGALLGGDLPHDLVEHAEEAGVELVPYGGELGTSCTCPGLVDPCVHALAALLQLGWLLEDDPLVLVHLRGLGREELLAAVHHRRDPASESATTSGAAGAPGSGGARVQEREDQAALDTAEDAVRRAALILDLLVDRQPDGHDPPELDDLW